MFNIAVTKTTPFSQWSHGVTSWEREAGSSSSSSAWRHHAISRQTSTVITCALSRGSALLRAAITDWQRPVNCPAALDWSAGQCITVHRPAPPRPALMAMKRRSSAGAENWNTQQSEAQRSRNRLALHSVTKQFQLQLRLTVRNGPHSPTGRAGERASEARLCLARVVLMTTEDVRPSRWRNERRRRDYLSASVSSWDDDNDVWTTRRSARIIASNW